MRVGRPTAAAADLIRRAAEFVRGAADTRLAPWTPTGLDEDVAGAPPRRRRRSGSSRAWRRAGPRTAAPRGAPANDFRITDGRSSRACSALVSRCVVAVQLTRGLRPQTGAAAAAWGEPHKGRAASEGGGELADNAAHSPEVLHQPGGQSVTGKAGPAGKGLRRLRQARVARGITPRRGRNLSDPPLVAIIENSVNLQGPPPPPLRGRGYRFATVSPCVSERAAARP